MESGKAIPIDLYFATPTATQLSAQSQHLELTRSTVKNCRQALEALITGPVSSLLSPIVSPSTRIRGMYLLENNELVIDFSRELESGHVHSASADLLLVNGIVQTLMQAALQGENDRPVRAIRFLFEGAPYQGTFPAHYDLSKPVRRPSPSATEGFSHDE